MDEIQVTRDEALARAAKEFRDVVARAIAFTDTSYEKLGHIYGVSGSWVYKLAAERGLRRQADKLSEVVND